MSAKPLAGIVAGVALVALLCGVGVGVWLGPRFQKKEVAVIPAPPASQIVYTPTTFAALNDWTRDSLADGLPALKASCAALSARNPDDAIGSDAIARPAKAWQAACAQVLGDAHDTDSLRAALEAAFTPYAVAGSDGDRGIFTGYYEAELAGSLTRTDRFKYPIYGVPRDLVTADLAAFAPDLAKAGPRQIVGRVAEDRGQQKLLPYFTREQIDSGGAVAATADILAWADDPVAIHILHIQGSGVMMLPDGSRLRIGFAGSNGRQFRGIGGILIEAGVLKPGGATMDAVRQWLTAHPADAVTYMNRNNRYIFFQIRPATDQAGPIGAQGVALTPGRSLAVDTAILPLGAPIWLETADPDGAPLHRLVMAQDTGAAITGAVRGDFYWGTGEAAFQKAARMRSPGRYFVLVPKP
jgi:membrane-bound lytic murein transglycosylase A